MYSMVQPSRRSPQTQGGLPSSPFRHVALLVLHRLSRALLFPSYWALDRFLVWGRPNSWAIGLHLLTALVGAAIALLLLLATLPLALLGLLLWLPLQSCRRPFCYAPPPPDGWDPPAPWRPSTDPPRRFGFLSSNLCLMPDGLARFSNLPHSQRRARQAGRVFEKWSREGGGGSAYGTTGSSPRPEPGDLGEVLATLPEELDFVCLQEMFDLRAEDRLVRQLGPALGHVLYDVGAAGLQSGLQLKLLGSGLLLASRYPLLAAHFLPFSNGCREDALASKGLLSAQVQLGMMDERRIVGYLHCTHLHAPEGDGHVRAKQLSLLLEWAEKFEAENSKAGDAVAFSVLMGDLNFDNCSSDNALEQKHEVFSCFTDPCRLGPCSEQPWALGTLLNTTQLHHPVASRPEALKSALAEEDGRRTFLAHLPTNSIPLTRWQGRRIDYILYQQGRPSQGQLAPVLTATVSRVTFSTALAGLTDHLAVGLQLQVAPVAPSPVKTS
ncbi:sphingomyelin phosphodiesterase 5-like [Tachyglossus aculeatus]|uniref:sphingomyelin phosphodiesterase 5-like n=1 Tax=Tachyglossus aculeatus TaxID=9261 RepID=UPI0018F4E133|nr:sphingomyelin phosphodiesterase 5-like [Tachyglossus aculeatus]XP_038616393.1 sphingomyelin phosphodiesterase 5-like [Tachyglossus aculeatus]